MYTPLLRVALAECSLLAGDRVAVADRLLDGGRVTVVGSLLAGTKVAVAVRLLARGRVTVVGSLLA